jgi:tripartite-type tricarboxylate transporter receptor subunit TctC
MGQVQAGTVRVLAAADHERSKFEPDTRTFKELGYPVAFSLWNSFCVPKKTPKRIVDILSNGMQEVFKRHGKEIEEALPKIEYVAYFLNREQSLQEMKRDYEFQSALVKELGVSAE